MAAPGDGGSRRDRNNQRRRQCRAEERGEDPRTVNPSEPGGSTTESHDVASNAGSARQPRVTQAAPGTSKGRGKGIIKGKGHGTGRAVSDPGTASAAPSTPMAPQGKGMYPSGMMTYQDEHGGWWWSPDGVQWYYTTPATPLEGIPRPAAPEKRSNEPKRDKDKKDVEKKSKKQDKDKDKEKPRKNSTDKPIPPGPVKKDPKKEAAAGGDPPDDGDDPDEEGDRSSYSYEYDYEYEEESEEEEPKPKKGVKAEPDPRSKKRLPKPVPRPAASEGSSVRTEEIRDMLTSKVRSAERAKPALSQVRLENFSGNRSQYRDWKRVLQAQQALYGLRDEELSMLVYLNCTGEAREILNQLDIREMQEAGGLARQLRRSRRPTSNIDVHQVSRWLSTWPT